VFNKLKDTAQGRLQTVVRYVEKRWISSRIRIYPITSWCVFRHDWQFYDPHPLIADVIISSFMTGVNL
jgi:hypothetical protein